MSGQEVEDNPKNCVLIQYIHSPPDPRFRSLFIIEIIKRAQSRALKSYSDA